MNRLRLDYLNHPRSAPAPLCDWELTRGFRIRAVAEKVLVLILGPAQGGGPALEPAPGPGEEALLLVLSPRPQDLELALSLPHKEGWDPAGVLVLSAHDSPPGALRQQLAAVARGVPWLVVWVLQDMPPGDFFNAEEVLHQSGRISRRISRRSRWRRLLPW